MEGKKRGRIRKDKDKDKDKEKSDDEERGEEDGASTEESDTQFKGEAADLNDVELIKPLDPTGSRSIKGMESNTSRRRPGNETPSSVKTNTTQDNASQQVKGSTAPQTPKGTETPAVPTPKGTETPVVAPMSGTPKQSQVDTTSMQKTKTSVGSVVSKVIKPKQSGEIEVEPSVQEEKPTEAAKMASTVAAVTPSTPQDIKSVVGPNNGRPNILPCAPGLLHKRTPFNHNPPYPEERRERIPCPRSARDYIINLREHLADFQESHGLPRTRDYSFFSLGLALAQETGRAIFSLFHMFTELFPILAIVSLILRFALDKLIEILETEDTSTKVKKSLIFGLEMIAIIIPLWILISTIILPLIALVLTILKNMLRIKGNKKTVVVRQKPKPQIKPSASTK